MYQSTFWLFFREKQGKRKDDLPKLDVDSMITLILLLDVLEFEIERLSGSHLSRVRKLLDQGQELVMIPSIVE